MAKFIKILKLLLLLVFNNIIIGMILGFIWYKVGYAIPKIEISSGIDVLKISILKYKYLFFILLFIMELISIILSKKLFASKKMYILYYLASLLVSTILYHISSFGFDTGSNNIIIEIKSIKEQYIFISCLGLRYNSWILTLNIPTLIGLIYAYNKKKHVVK